MAEWLGEVGAGAVRLYAEIAPFLLLGFALAGLFYLLLPARAVARGLGGSGFLPVLRASLIGLPLPLCSCGVIPAAIGLRRQGASRGATAAFMISTPETGIDAFLLTVALKPLGLPFAILRVVFSFLTALATGTLVNRLDPDPALCLRGREAEAAGSAVPPRRGAAAWVRAGAAYAFNDLLAGIYLWLVAGIILAAVIESAVPAGWAGERLGRGIVPLLAAMAVGLPMYVCATASTPIAAAMIYAGLSPGAALVFLLTGPATNVATMLAVWRFLGRRTFAIYLGSIILVSLGAGLLTDAVFPGGFGAAGAAARAPEARPAVTPIETAAAAALTALILRLAFLQAAGRFRSVHIPMLGSGEVLDFKLGGLDCVSCRTAVERALQTVEGVSGVEVASDLQGVRISYDGDREKVAGAAEDAISKSGFTAERCG